MTPSQLNPPPILATCFSKIHLKVILLSPSWSFKRWFLITFLCIIFVFPFLATYPSHSVLDFTGLTMLSDLYELWSFSLCNCSNTYDLHSSVKARDLVSQPYKTTGRIVVLFTLIFIVLERRWVISFWTV